MRRLSLLTAAALVAAVASPAVAAPPPEAPAAQTAHLDFAGKGAIAVWTTCPNEPGAGLECTTTFLSATFVKRENRTPVRAATALFEQSTIRFEEGLEVTVLSSTFASGPIDLAVDRALGGASFQAAMGSQTCAPVGGEIACEEGTATVAASWTGTGALVRFTENSTPGGNTGGPPLLIVHERRAARPASATASLDSVAVPGDLVFAEVFDGARSFVLVCRGGPGVDPADCPAP